MRYVGVVTDRSWWMCATDDQKHRFMQELQWDNESPPDRPRHELRSNASFRRIYSDEVPLATWQLSSRKQLIDHYIRMDSL